MFLKRMMTGIVIASVMVVAAPAVASAESLWVAKAPTTTGTGKSCTRPGYKGVQEAVAAAGSGATIRVCTGTYEEQLEITKSLNVTAMGTVTVQLPATPAKSTGACSAAQSAETEDVVEVCGGVAVKMTGVDVRGAWPSSTCNNNLYDILVGNGAELKLINSSVLDAGAAPINGCQGGVGIRVGDSHGAGSAMLKNVVVTGYQKEGIEIDGAGSKASVKDSTVTGAGPTSVIAQNGIQVSRGATARIASTVVTKNQYEGSASACGIIMFEAATGSSIKGSKINENDIGIDLEESGTATLKVSRDEFITNRYAGVFETEGNVVVNKSLFNGGEVGIELFSFEGEPSGPTGTGSGDTIENASEFAVAGFTSNGPAGSFTITKSKISGNPGPTPQESVHSEPPVIITTTASDS